MNLSRRQLVLAATAATASLAAPAVASSRRAIVGMTEGPFYPPRPWRAQWPDWDADLTRVEGGGTPAAARGEHLALVLRVADTLGRIVDRTEVEIWQCDALAAYRHPGVRLVDGAYDPGFQGFGSALAGRDGVVRFRTIRPVPYPGRTPHIHLTLRHPNFGERTSQLFVDGDPGNARDFLWRRLRPEDQTPLALRLQPAAGEGLRWQVQHTVVVPA